MWCCCVEETDGSPPPCVERYYDSEAMSEYNASEAINESYTEKPKHQAVKEEVKDALPPPKDALKCEVRDSGQLPAEHLPDEHQNPISIVQENQIASVPEAALTGSDSRDKASNANDIQQPSDYDRTNKPIRTTQFLVYSYDRCAFGMCAATVQHAYTLAVLGLFSNRTIQVTPSTAWLRGLQGMAQIVVWVPGIINGIINFGLKDCTNPDLVAQDKDIEWLLIIYVCASSIFFSFLVHAIPLGWYFQSCIGIFVSMGYGFLYGKKHKVDKQCVKAFLNCFNAFLVAGNTNVGMAMVYPYIAKAIPSVAGILLTVTLTTTLNLGMVTQSKIYIKNPMFLRAAFVQVLCMALVANTEGLRSGALLASLLQDANDSSWIQALSSGFIINLVSRTGWARHMILKLPLIGSLIAPPNCFIWVSLDAKYKLSYSKLALPLGLIIGRIVIGVEGPWYINENFGLMILSTFLLMLVEDVLCATISHFSAPQPSPQTMKKYESHPCPAYVLNAHDQAEPAVVWRQQSWKQDILILACLSSSAAWTALAAVMPMVSMKCLLGLSNTCEAKVDDGCLWWPY